MGASKRMIASRRVGSVSDARSQTDIFQSFDDVSTYLEFLDQLKVQIHIEYSHYGTVLVSTHSTLVIALT